MTDIDLDDLDPLDLSLCEPCAKHESLKRFILKNGQTGIREVDAVIRIHNPHGLKSPARIISPDGGKPRLKTWGRTI